MRGWIFWISVFATSTHLRNPNEPAVTIANGKLHAVSTRGGPFAVDLDLESEPVTIELDPGQPPSIHVGGVNMVFGEQRGHGRVRKILRKRAGDGLAAGDDSHRALRGDDVTIKASDDKADAVMLRVPQHVTASSIFKAQAAPGARSRARATPRVLYVCITSRRLFPMRGSFVWSTWGHTIAAPNAFVFATDRRLPGALPQWVSGDTTDTYRAAEGRFIDALMQVPWNGSWVFLLDDDGFVNHHELVRVLAAKDPADPAVYGEKTCDPICGGGGMLFSPALVRRLRAASLHGSDCVASGQLYDVWLPAQIQRKGLGAVRHHAGFHSQPPSFYALRNSKIDQNDAISFHYLDARHQRENSRMYGCESAGCPELYDSIYKRYYVGDS